MGVFSMSNIKSLKLNTKYLKTGGYSVIISVVAIAIVIIINLVVNRLPVSYTRFDTTSTDMYSLTDETKNVVKRVKDDIKIYYVAEHGKEDANIDNILNKYKDLNKKITLQQIDPAVNIAFFTGDRAELSVGSIVVESAKRSKNITYNDIYYNGIPEEDLINYQYYYGQYPESTTFSAEKCLTSAIKYVTTDVLPIIYTLKGHGEMTLDTVYIEAIKSESMQMKELNLSTVEAVPEDCDSIFICSPSSDLTKEESDRLLNYLKSGGKLMYVSYYGGNAKTDKPNLDSVLSYYGLSSVKGYIVEGDSNYAYPNNPTYLLPAFSNHTITKKLIGTNMVMTGCQGIGIADDLRDTLKVTSLISTSNKAYSKVNENATTVSKEDGDIDGPFNIGVAVSEVLDDGNETQLVWINAIGMEPSVFVNSFAWMCNIEDLITIPSKTDDISTLEINEAQSTLLTWVFAVIIPVATVGTGFVVWYRRRSK